MFMTCGYYVIKPSEAFKNKLTMLDLEPDLLESISQIQLWEHNRVSPIESEGDIAEIKLLFLANIKSLYLGANLYQIFFEDNHVSLEIFDKWWGIDRYFVEEDFAEVEEEIDAAIASEFVKTGIERVDLWIDSLQKKHNSD
ncbi:hypothetical protein Osc7112_6769 (plasmid) [Oscillatoria nigro-viridis PCC 7112]|uniref:Uncharacterized protein n=1 Tax=Phormidium nigroviride PCC 7112 TaxID=179408 RepID=K9VTP9_9CYAN|nr:hypothetical protein [Oscillatoria nigro-viridis]AFZ10862.1 hypothetical protein Osc7112_6769 [Oscillatoria nigro-viridis PCC 7112]